MLRPHRSAQFLIRCLRRSMFLVFASTSGLFAACATAPPKVTIIPREEGSYYVIAYSSSESAALNAAAERATQYCETKGKRFVLAKETAHSESLAEDAKKAAEVAKMMIGEVIGRSAKSEDHKQLVYSRSGDELAMMFKCVSN